MDKCMTTDRLLPKGKGLISENGCLALQGFSYFFFFFFFFFRIFIKKKQVNIRFIPPPVF